MRQLCIRLFKKNNCESTITIKLLQLQKKRSVIEETSLEEISVGITALAPYPVQ